ncbi:MAG: Uma2 family endonuclease [Chloroflexota bacterium]
MAESDFQRKPLMYAVQALDYFFRHDPDVYVTGNIILYYEEGNPLVSVSPDVMVVFGVDKHLRPSYFVWREGKAPDFVIEITSKSTRSADQGSKRGLYAYLGVREYFQYDPTGDYLDPQLQGFRLVGRNFQRMPGDYLEDGTYSIHSDVLGLDLQVNLAGEFHFFNPTTGEMLLTYDEAEEARRNAEEKAQHETAARQQLEAQLAELQARLRAVETNSSSDQ